MGDPAKKSARYEDLYHIPENMVGEIIDGELYVHPRPSMKHSNVVSGLQDELGPPYRRGRGGPGGWVILFEPELRLGENTLVPDLAGWKKERLPAPPKTNWCDIAPDWVCEVLSPSTIRMDKTRKMPAYAQHNVSHLWLVDPRAKTLDVFRLESKRWLLVSSHAEDDLVRAEPFREIEISLADLWWE